MPNPIDDHSPGLGARLRSRGTRWGAFIMNVESALSTNELAHRFARRGAPHGSLFLAREQTAGRGRWHRAWESKPGGLYLSIVLRPDGDFRPSLLPLLVSVSVAESIIALTGLEVRLRWPNDLYESGRKLGGILCEGSFKGAEPESFVAGIGVNVNQRMDDFSDEVAQRATSLERSSLHELDLAAAIVAGLERWWEAREPSGVLSRWSELADGDHGMAIRVQPREGDSYDAVTRGLSDDGGLVVESQTGVQRILYAEDVLYLR